MKNWPRLSSFCFAVTRARRILLLFHPGSRFLNRTNPALAVSPVETKIATANDLANTLQNVSFLGSELVAQPPFRRHDVQDVWPWYTVTHIWIIISTEPSSRQGGLAVNNNPTTVFHGFSSLHPSFPQRPILMQLLPLMDDIPLQWLPLMHCTSASSDPRDLLRSGTTLLRDITLGSRCYQHVHHLSFD